MYYHYEILATQPNCYGHFGTGGNFEEVYVKQHKLGVKEVDGGMILAIHFGPNARRAANKQVRELKEQESMEQAQTELIQYFQKTYGITIIDRRYKQKPMWYMGHELPERRKVG